MAAKNELAEYGQLVFDGWPTLNLYLKGEKFDQSITPTVMKGLIELQKGVYQAYAVAKFHNSHKRLTNEEKDDLEIAVRVNNGSAALEINFPDVATKFIEQLAGKMDGNQIVIMVVTVALMYFGKSAYNNFLENRKEVQLKKSSDETQQKTLESLNFMSAEETKRAAIMADVAKGNTQAREIQSIAEVAQSEVLKAMAAGDSSKIGNTVLSHAVTEALTQGMRRESKEVRLDGEYRTVKLDWSLPSALKVKVRNVKTGLELNATLQDDSLTGSYKEAFKEAEWSRRVLNLEINAKKLGDDDYRDVVIVNATLLDNPRSSD